MFNKDQYDQEHYNDYYEQETQGAEILGGRRKGSGGVKKFLVSSALLALISAGGYFGYKHIIDNSDKNTTNTQRADSKGSSNEGVKKVIVSEVVDGKVEAKVEEVVSSNGVEDKISPEDIANIVQLVMMKMKEEQEEQESAKESSEKKTQDSDQKGDGSSKVEDLDKDKRLIDSLAETEVDTIKEEKQEDSIKKISSETTKEAGATDGDNIKDTYNKVVLKNNSKGDDELSKISNDLSNIVEDETKSKDKSESNGELKQKLEEEVKQRKKEMRYVIVKKGDTLGKIAKRVYGNVMAYKKIYKANPDILKRPDRIYIGQKLRVPE